VADPASETRREFLERARKKIKCPMAKIIEKAKAVEGLWELWPEEDDEEETPPAKPKAKAKAKAKGKAKAKAEPKAEPKAAPAPAEKKRGRPNGNAELKERILGGGEVETLEEYDKAHRVIESDLQQQRRLLRAGKEEEAAALSGTIEAMHQARDRWADANGVERKRRVEERQRLNNMKIKAGVQRDQRELALARATSSPRSCVRATARRAPLTARSLSQPGAREKEAGT
jgi:hypothetical protein